MRNDIHIRQGVSLQLVVSSVFADVAEHANACLSTAAHSAYAKTTAVVALSLLRLFLCPSAI